MGVSMGASTVLMSANLLLPPTVKGIIADCGFTSPKAIVKCVMHQRGFPDFLYPLAALGPGLFGGFSLSSSSAPHALHASSIPVLLFHGEDDRFVPCEMSRETYNSRNQHIYLHTVAQAGHAMSYFLDSDGYARIYRQFLLGDL